MTFDLVQFSKFAVCSFFVLRSVDFKNVDGVWRDGFFSLRSLGIGEGGGWILFFFSRVYYGTLLVS